MAGREVTGRKLDEAEAPWTMSIPECGAKYLGIGRAASYLAAAAGTIPTIKAGRRKLALPKVLEARLARDPAEVC